MELFKRYLPNSVGILILALNVMKDFSVSSMLKISKLVPKEDASFYSTTKRLRLHRGPCTRARWTTRGMLSGEACGCARDGVLRERQPR